jgi:hypothetical protein
MGLQMPLSKEDILLFLDHGTVGATPDKWFDLEQNGKVTLRKQFAEKLGQASILKTIQDDGSFDKDNKFHPQLGFIAVSGTFSTKRGDIFFWELWDDHVLHLQAPDGQECLIRLPK